MKSYKATHLCTELPLLCWIATVLEGLFGEYYSSSADEVMMVFSLVRYFGNHRNALPSDCIAMLVYNIVTCMPRLTLGQPRCLLCVSVCLDSVDCWQDILQNAAETCDWNWHSAPRETDALCSSNWVRAARQPHIVDAIVFSQEHSVPHVWTKAWFGSLPRLWGRVYNAGCIVLYTSSAT